MVSNVALIIVDLQEDFLPPNGSLAIQSARSIIPKINNLITSKSYNWSTIIATQDWHPQTHASFASQHNQRPFTTKTFQHPEKRLNPNTGEIIEINQTLWPDHCVENTFGSSLEKSFHDNFNQLENKAKIIIKKGYLQDREYYSAFQDCWHLHKTELENYLRQLNIEKVVFVGLAYDFCVLNSAIDCSKLDFKTYVLKDYCRSVYPDKFVETDTEYMKNGVEVIEGIHIPEL
ncbi:unnamed protein product [Candida verbasci]|uniref:nicotinamidase n=1 Tax=Candida verbasci TaxID=1227364 RepID=A0A9W4U0I5_9ASCO|nr:unnamed protein product [Candida verbasci]